MKKKDEVLSLIIKGHSIKEIADIACISKSAVTYHITKILKEHGVSTRNQLLASLAVRK